MVVWLVIVFLQLSGAKKKQLHVDKPDDDLVVDTYDALDDYDFMWAFGLAILGSCLLSAGLGLILRALQVIKREIFDLYVPLVKEKSSSLLFYDVTVGHTTFK